VKSWFPHELDDDLAAKLITKFASHAYRHPAHLGEYAPILEFYESQRAVEMSPAEALELSYQAILCSPGFLYHRTKQGVLSDHEIASRLSFFLWSSPPDKQLRDLADQGILGQSTNLKAQAERLLNDPRSARMVASFTDAWLQLSKLGTMLPDRVEHPGYYNERLEEAMRTETRLFVSDAIKHDLGVEVFVDSDHSFLNSSLARLYGVSGVEGHEFQRVKFSDRRRGGLLGQASVLTASANGIDTSPVLRGVWVMECLLGTPPSPPPPDIEPLEPDIRGAKTIRDQLAKHRDVATCNNCHRRIDPPGFALESFDEIGRFRSHYMHGATGERQGLAVDPSGKLSSGEPFSDVGELKSLLLKRLDLVAHNVARKLLVQATGRIDDANDNADVIRLVQEATGSYNKENSRIRGSVGMRTLIHSLIQSDAFRR
jgi:hypothetical protein